MHTVRDSAQPEGRVVSACACSPASVRGKGSHCLICGTKLMFSGLMVLAFPSISDHRYWHTSKEARAHMFAWTLRTWRLRMRAVQCRTCECFTMELNPGTRRGELEKHTFLDVFVQVLVRSLVFGDHQCWICEKVAPCRKGSA